MRPRRRLRTHCSGERGARRRCLRAPLLLGTLPALRCDPEVVDDFYENLQVLGWFVPVVLQDPLAPGLDVALVENLHLLGHPGQEGVKRPCVVVLVRERVMGIDLPAVRVEADTEEEQHLIPPVFEAAVRQIEAVSHDLV